MRSSVVEEADNPNDENTDTSTAKAEESHLSSADPIDQGSIENDSDKTGTGADESDLKGVAVSSELIKVRPSSIRRAIRTRASSLTGNY